MRESERTEGERQKQTERQGEGVGREGAEGARDTVLSYFGRLSVDLLIDGQLHDVTSVKETRNNKKLPSNRTSSVICYHKSFIAKPQVLCILLL